MRADIHDGPEHMLQSEAGYIDARPLTPARQNLLQRTAGPYIRVISTVLTVGRSRPVYPDKQTSSDPVGMSQTCQFRTHAAPQNASAEYRRRASWPKQVSKICPVGYETPGVHVLSQSVYRRQPVPAKAAGKDPQ